METAGGFTARRGQIASADPRLAVVIVGSQLPRISERAGQFVNGRTECVLLVAKQDGAWTIQHVIANPDSNVVPGVTERFGLDGSSIAIVDPRLESSEPSRSETSLPSLADELARPSFTREDCELLARYTPSVRWREVPEGERDALNDLRERLKCLALFVQASLPATIPLATHASMRNVRSYAAKDMWCCVYPQSAANKSYALQVAFIVSPAGAELCFCLGSGSAMERVEEHRETNRASFAELQGRLATLPSAERTRLTALVDAGWNLRRAWRQEPGSEDFTDVAAWIDYASSSAGGGASISTNLSADELDSLGPGVSDEVAALAEAVFPILAWIYGEEPAQTFDLTSLVAACSAKLSLPAKVYANLWSALESGKHVILTGPPGTGKTTLAQLVGELATRSGRCTGWVLTTATADWTTFETIGGLRPSDEGLQFSEGHFLTAIRERKWLIIDELNRSNFDRAFGQLFTVLSKQPVVLPYKRAGFDEPVTLVPSPKTDYAALGGDQLEVPGSWRIIATMNVFDKSLLFEMSYALMRRFAFVEVPSPDDAAGGDFKQLVERASTDDADIIDPVARSIATDLMSVRRVKDIGPASFMDIARFVRFRRSAGSTPSEGELAWDAFYSFLLPQFEGIDERQGRQLYRILSPIVGRAQSETVRATFRTVLGVSDFAFASAEREEGDEPSADDET